MGQRFKVALKPGHIGCLEGLKLALQIVEHASSLIQFAVQFADAVVEGAAGLLMGLFAGLELTPKRIELSLKISACALGTLEVCLEPGL
ncbi:hypothetical protein ECTPHS_12243 [Ectothiorhodospira sp. PHS-1]|nr:hypothetical protein ECTPHS_12243 [Ectothiorhodospira sp. PHS-1]